MRKVIEDEDTAVIKNYLPHHGVLRKNSRSTKLRVVFDASVSSTNGNSLNDLLLNGGMVQEELFTILLRFRTHRIAFIADIVKMYRQIWIDENQCDLQRILWKGSPDGKIEEYKLLTVTYGTKSAPFLATRVLKQLARDESKDLPLASSTLLRDVYMDDILSGTSDVESALVLKGQLIELLRRGGMELHKWSANSERLVAGYNLDEGYQFENNEQKSVKTLGLMWDPKDDSFSFTTSKREISKIKYTKTMVLSEIAKLFDPLGLLGPVVTYAKILVKELWILHIEWDQVLPPKEQNKWLLLWNSLYELNNCKIKRELGIRLEGKIEIHGYSDASEAAYGACVYVKCIQPDNNIVVNLLCSKSRVAPVKRVTVPRLELCGALLLSHLVNRVIGSLRLKIENVHLWSDSTIVLSWIKTPSYRLKTFVANRVVTIQELTSLYAWHHVPSEKNPADLLSRGVLAGILVKSELWWHGPEQLRTSMSIPEYDLEPKSNDKNFERELKIIDCVSLHAVQESSCIQEIIERKSQYLKILIIIAYVSRFTWNCRNFDQKRAGYITSSELEGALMKAVKIAQSSEFRREWKNLKKGEEIAGNSKLKTLNPFLDDNELLRVVGRLANASLPYAKKHPLILPSKHKVTILIFENIHQVNLHVGPQSLLNLVRQKFWPLRGKSIANKVVRQCFKCFKEKPITQTQLMADLPSERVRASFAFNTVGVDFCGPFLVKYPGQRKGIGHKAYVAVFVCFSTKAVHLELVMSLTSEAFIACLKRFFAGRGKSAKIVSDNATNFVGANNQLKRLHDLLLDPDERLADYYSAEEVQWSFIPPGSPHFGGLWEAGVRSMKQHLKRTLGQNIYHYEEFLSIVAQIEAILNSRPLTHIYSTADVTEVLTPGHFLVGRPLRSIEEAELLNIADNRLNRWQRVTKVTQSIWKRWQKEYLNCLQQRYKWRDLKPNVKIGDIVLLKEATPINKWPLGVVHEVIKGKDDQVRVLMVKTTRGLFKRAVTKICLLPLREESSEVESKSSTGAGMFNP